MIHLLIFDYNNNFQFFTAPKNNFFSFFCDYLYTVK